MNNQKHTPEGVGVAALMEKVRATMQQAAIMRSESMTVFLWRKEAETIADALSRLTAGAGEAFQAREPTAEMRAAAYPMIDEPDGLGKAIRVWKAMYDASPAPQAPAVAWTDTAVAEIEARLKEFMGATLALVDLLPDVILETHAAAFNRISDAAEKLSDDELAALHPAEPLTAEAGTGEAWNPTHRHAGRGTDYQLLGTGLLQWSPRLGDMDPVTIYRDVHGQTWVRGSDEFNDGRFAALTSTPETDNER